MKHTSHTLLITLETITDDKGNIINVTNNEKLINNNDNKAIIDSLNSTNKILANVVRRLNKLEK
jgi:hypothetical protein